MRTSGSRVFFVGGITTDGESSNVIDIYDAPTGTWSVDNTPNIADSRCGRAVEVDSAMLVIGAGAGASREAGLVSYRYDGDTSTWSLTGTLPRVRCVLRAFSVGSTVVVYGQDREDLIGPAVIDLYDDVTGVWTQAAVPELPLFGVGFAEVDNTILFAGGRGYCGKPCVGRARDLVALYDRTTGLWSSARLSQARWDVGEAVVGSRVFFGGGTFHTREGLASQSSDRVDIYYKATDLWTTATLSQARSDPTAFTIGQTVLFVGGSRSYRSSSDVVDLYDSATGTWTTSRLSEPRSHHGTIPIGQKVLFGGGQRDDESGSDVVDIYDSASNTWSTGRLSRPMTYPSSIRVGRRAVFGVVDQDAMRRLDIYDDESGEWSTVTLSAQPEGGDVSFASVGHRLLVSGGSDGVVDIYDFDDANPSVT